jgi:geranylgeranyl reductase family protein
MANIENIDVLIVGSGPAGTSTALHLIQQDTSWADRILVVDKAIHPREKLCGGGITHMGQNVLARLGLTIETPSMPLRRADIVFENLSFSFHANPIFVIIRRDEFDHWFVQKAEARGVRVRQGEAVLDVIVQDDFVEVTTEKSVIQAKVLVAADGSRSFVRRKLKWDDESRVARLLEILTPEDRQLTAEFRENKAVLDFTPMKDGLQGYYWDFPSIIKGESYMNRGLFDSRAQPKRPKADLKRELRRSLDARSRNLDDYKLKGHPIRWFGDDGRYAIPRVILAGDAAGTDPLAGEGISFALAYGDVAAVAIVDAFTQRDFSFADYGERIVTHQVLKQLPVRVRLARLIYRLSKYPWICRLIWRAIAFAMRFSRWKDPDYDPVQQPVEVHAPEEQRGRPYSHQYVERG